MKCDGKLEYVSGQCCPVCQPQCAPKIVSQKVKIGECVSKDSVELNMCSGTCGSSATVDLEKDPMSIVSDCKCCQPVQAVQTKMTIECVDGRSKTITYKKITQCECNKCGASSGSKSRRIRDTGSFNTLLKMANLNQ